MTRIDQSGASIYLETGDIFSEKLRSLGVPAEVLAPLQQPEDGGPLILQPAQHLNLGLNQALDSVLTNEKRVLGALTNEIRRV